MVADETPRLNGVINNKENVYSIIGLRRTQTLTKNNQIGQPVGGLGMLLLSSSLLVGLPVYHSVLPLSYTHTPSNDRHNRNQSR